MLSDSEIFEIVSQMQQRPEEKLERLIESANQKGGKDNISAILICCGEGDRS